MLELLPGKLHAAHTPHTHLPQTYKGRERESRAALSNEAEKNFRVEIREQIIGLNVSFTVFFFFFFFFFCYQCEFVVILECNAKKNNVRCNFLHIRHISSKNKIRNMDLHDLIL